MKEIYCDKCGKTLDQVESNLLMRNVMQYDLCDECLSSFDVWFFDWLDEGVK